MAACAPATLRRLRQDVAKIEGQPTALDVGLPSLALGIAEIDRHLQGGLLPASLHEIAPAAVCDIAAAAGFTLALAARAGNEGETLWIQTGFAGLEAGNLYGPGCDLFGLSARRLLILTVPRPIDALWAMEEALRSRALTSVIAELPNDGPLADLTATRRLTLAAREGESFGFLLRHTSSTLTSSAETRWQVAAAPGEADRFGGLGRAAWMLSLIKNRHGATGRWRVAWNDPRHEAGHRNAWDHDRWKQTGVRHEHAASTLSLGVAATAVDRPDRTSLVRAG